MSIKKYRFYLLMITLVIVGALSYFYFTKQEEDYRDGTLVQIDYLVGEELV